MSATSKFSASSRTKLLLCSTLASVGFMPMAALAQAGNGQLADIVVTAQKREQNVQDVPIAVTALGPAALVTNRVTDVTDLSGLAPGVRIVTSAGGSQLPAFSVRGVTSYGVVPGSDKEVSIYLDGVYISSPRGSIFNMPDMAGIELLRGPQGTLFGRNATAGAVSMTTRDPNGKIGATAVFTAGNYDQFGAKFTFSTPQVGPFSAYVTYSHQYKRGDVKNLAAGTVWNRTASQSEAGIIASSPAYLGTKRADSYFIAVKFQPTDNFKMVYKRDSDVEYNSPEATVPLTFNPLLALSPRAVGLFNFFTAHPEFFSPSGLRPEAASNGYSLTRPERVSGHSFTSTWDVNDNLSIKNITAWRKNFVSVASTYDGFAGYTLTAADSQLIAGSGVLTGAQYGLAGLQPESHNNQFSSEFQANYHSKALTLTAGVLWFHGIDYSGSPKGMQNAVTFPKFGGVIGLGQIGDSYNDAKSAAVYAQAEFHVTPKLDLVLGGRYTKDSKSGKFVAGLDATSTTTLTVPFTFVKSKPSWLVGVNYKPTDDMLIYAKASTANVSGGSASGIPFAPEEAMSYEAGIKAEWFDRRLRTNLAIYTVTYKYLQLAQGKTNFIAQNNAIGATLGIPVVCPIAGQVPDATCNGLGNLISTFVSPIGGTNDPAPVTSRGVEFDFAGSVGHGFTVGGSLGYNKTRLTTVDPRILISNGTNAAYPNGEYLAGSLQPNWTGGLYGQLETKPFANGSHIVARIDGNWHGSILNSAAPDVKPAWEQPYLHTGAAWIMNGRVALTDINIGGVNGEIAAWGKNLTQNRDITFGGADLSGVVNPANFQPARTLGVDVKIHY